MAFEAGAEPLLELAKSRAPLDREQLLARIAELCEKAAGALPGRMAAEIEVVCVALANELAPAARVRLARRVAWLRWAPRRLIEILAFDEIEAARPVIAESPVLSDEALTRLVVEGTAAHRLAVAARPGLSSKVAAAIIEKGDPTVLAELIANQSADIAPHLMLRLVEQARTLAALAAPLARHPRMTPKLAEGLYQAGESVRAAVTSRFEVAKPEVEAAAVTQSVAETTAGARPHGPEPAELMLVDKLASGGMLKPGYLLRTLREQRLGLFEAALAKLGEFSNDEVCKAVRSRDKPELLALACAAVGIDRSVFPSILEMVRQCNDGLPGGGEAGARRAASAFGPFPPAVAKRAFHQAVASV